MKALALALVVLVGSLAWQGHLGGWTAAWHALRARASVHRSTESIVHRAAALDAEPLSRKSRLALAEAVEQGIAKLGVERIPDLAPRSTIGRATVAAALDERGEAAKASAVRAAIGATRPEEILFLTAAELRAIGIDAAVADRCREALPLLDTAVRRGLGDWNLLVKRATCLTEAADPASAIEALLPMYDYNPESPWVRLLLAQNEARLGHLDTAVAITWTLVRTNPDFYEMWRFAGALNAAMNEPAHAARCYRRALRLRPQNTWLKGEIWKQERAARARASATSTPGAGL